MSAYVWALQAPGPDGAWNDDPDAYGTAFPARHDIDPAQLAARMLHTYGRPGQRVAVFTHPRRGEPIATAENTNPQD